MIIILKTFYWLKRKIKERKLITSYFKKLCIVGVSDKRVNTEIGKNIFLWSFLNYKIMLVRATKGDL